MASSSAAARRRTTYGPIGCGSGYVGYDLRNFAYTYNSVSDRSVTHCGLVLLAACTIPAFFIKRGAYAQHRVRTLAVNMIVTMTIPWFFLHPAFVVHSTNNLQLYMAISVIALAFNACVFIYQAYTIFGKKRNPFKQELYIDNPRFRRVASRVSMFRRPARAALANLGEEFGYEAAWTKGAASRPWSHVRNAMKTLPAACF